MALNPIVYTEKIVSSFLRYQLTAYPFTDPHLLQQMRQLLSLEATRNTPLLKGPYVSLSQPFRRGAAVADLVAEGLFHPHLRRIIPAAISHLYGHQEQAIRAVMAGKTTLVSTGTGSGKTECFLYPVISQCLRLRDERAAPGIAAVLVYPMNALAEDQLGRLRGLLAGSGVAFGMYVGKTPETERDVTGVRLEPGSSSADYQARLIEAQREGQGTSIHPPEEICSREAMRGPGGQPRILLTNVKQLELLLTRQMDVDLFAGARLDFLVFDEAHTFAGANGAETACLIRRLRRFCGKEAHDTVCIATSATIVDDEQPDAARDFASRFFGVAPGQVETVGEMYEPAAWGEPRSVPPPPPGPVASHLAEIVKAVDAADPEHAVRHAFGRLVGTELPGGDWREALYTALSTNELVYRLTEAMDRPRPLADLAPELEPLIGRPTSEEELLAWLTFGAAAQRESRPLLRPVVHGFIRGISGAVVSFPEGEERPRLWLSPEDEAEASGEPGGLRLPVMTCTTCGQHYFTTFLKDFKFTGKRPAGGEVVEGSSYWPRLDQVRHGVRVVLVDRLLGSDDDDDEPESDRLAPLHFCRGCGAAHPEAVARCLGCGAPPPQVRLHAVRQKADNPGVLSSCLSCRSTGRSMGTRYREPARQVRATNVADVHVLTQDMVHHAERRRLLVFADNRQDAAFQAGWMKDHARRFRLRAIMADGLAGGPVSIGDLARHLDDVLEADEALSRALVPEVWNAQRREGSGGMHERERRKFLRYQVLREVTLTPRQRLGLEPWGRMKVEYQGLSPDHPFIQASAAALGIAPTGLCDGIASLLDSLRRRRVLFDPEHGIFSKYWQDGDRDIQNGFLPNMGGPVATKLRRTSSDKPQLVAQWVSQRGDTMIRQLALKWGVVADEYERFLGDLFQHLRAEEIGILIPVTLRGSHDRAIPGANGVYQINADRVRLTQHRGCWRCNICRRQTARGMPRNLCPAWRCSGTLEHVSEDPDSYDLQLLDQGYSMLRPEEHTAMVPAARREHVENLFKGESDAVNCLVCTPTLELGVDIGALDSTLMRNVPPLPANYWQRVGRAGRRHRMAVNITYCRPVSHDRAYFGEPLKLLDGRIDPPAFNLRNGLMVAKHVHATVITRLFQLARESSGAAGAEIEATLAAMLPRSIGAYLFDPEGNVRSAPFDLGPLRRLISQRGADLVAYVESVFRQGWPEGDADVVTRQALAAHVERMVDSLDEVIGRLRRRLRWALEQIARLAEVRHRKGTLEAEEDAHFRRCDRLIKQLKGAMKRRRSQAEGYDDTNTYGALAAEGFLPGYGLDAGSIVGIAEVPFWRLGATEFSLPRPPGVALREYVPGNLIYANGNKFVARRFHRDVEPGSDEVPVFEVSAERQALREASAAAAASTLGGAMLPAIRVCDVDLVHVSHISDEEETRFQLPVIIYGSERRQHDGGTAYRWGERALHLRRGVRMRLVNVGATSLVESGHHDRYGYPVCTVCGLSVSPLSSERQQEEFARGHEERCGRKPKPVAFFADIVADAISLPACRSHEEAFTVLEAIRMAATRLLDMHIEDLQVLVIGNVDGDEVDGLLWDPMPGGSGLLVHICQRFSEIVEIAQEILGGCPSACGRSCIDCLQTFRNAFYHRHLNRMVGDERIEEWGDALVESHQIPPMIAATQEAARGRPANEAERTLRHLLMAAGFPEGTRNEQIRLGPAQGTTTPDIIFRADDHEQDEGICVYLDGLSERLHGNPTTAAQDREIRAWLRGHGYEVIEIAASDLDDREAMTRHFGKLARYLGDVERRSALRDDPTWFDRVGAAAAEPLPVPYRVVHPEVQERNVTCIPLLSLRAAAGGFSQPDHTLFDECEWVEIRTGHRLRAGMFVAQVVGRSMEPLIPDGAYCLFRSPVEGSRNGKVVLVLLRDTRDPETGQGFTVKRYQSETVESDDATWRHLRITLSPVNREYEPIVLADDGEDGRVQMAAEFVAVLE